MEYPKLTDAEAKDLMKTKPHPRVTEESIKAKIENVAYTVVDGHGMLCIITLQNGWMSTGFSAPADPRNFDPAIGEKSAYDHAFQPLWQLEGYLLREQLHGQKNA
jgi:hypothetical protein